LETDDYNGIVSKLMLNILGMFMVVFGAIWFLQGMSVLPGSFMSGQIRWAFYGGIAMMAGLAVLLNANRQHRKN
jgi:hypothetical protein